MQDASQEKTNVAEQSALEKEIKKEEQVIKEILKEEKQLLKAETTTHTAKKTYPVDEEDKEMEAEILKALKEIKPLSDKIKCMILNSYLQEDKQFNVELEAELAIINSKYRKLAQPLVDKTNEIVGGRVPHEDELKGIHLYMTPEEIQKKDESFASIKPIEGYWLKVMKGSMVMKQFIQERDEEALKSLKTIKFTPSHDSNTPHDFTLIFTFGPNEYFENEVLEKHFQMKEEKECKKTTASDIKWKEGKNLTKKSVTKKQKNKKTGKTRTVTKEVDCDSFFSFFKTVEGSEKKPHEHKDDESCSEDEHGDELLDHTDFGTSLLEEILPYHLEYYLGVKKDLDFGGGQGEDDDDDMSDGDDSEEDEKPKKAKGGKKGGKGGAEAAGGAKQQQCNQQ
jgi:nucleosome assembly protein 1-like 1